VHSEEDRGNVTCPRTPQKRAVTHARRVYSRRREYAWLGRARLAGRTRFHQRELHLRLSIRDSVADNRARCRVSKAAQMELSYVDFIEMLMVAEAGAVRLTLEEHAPCTGRHRKSRRPRAPDPRSRPACGAATARSRHARCVAHSRRDLHFCPASSRLIPSRWLYIGCTRPNVDTADPQNDRKRQQMRRGWDSNPRKPCSFSGFQVR